MTTHDEIENIAGCISYEGTAGAEAAALIRRLRAERDEARKMFEQTLSLDLRHIKERDEARAAQKSTFEALTAAVAELDNWRRRCDEVRAKALDEAAHVIENMLSAKYEPTALGSLFYPETKAILALKSQATVPASET